MSNQEGSNPFIVLKVKRLDRVTKPTMIVVRVGSKDGFVEDNTLYVVRGRWSLCGLLDKKKLPYLSNLRSDPNWRVLYDKAEYYAEMAKLAESKPT